MGVRVYPDGGFHRFVLGGLTVSLNANSFCSDVSGTTLYDKFGYDRKQSVEQFAKYSYNYAGKSRLSGPTYKPPHVFTWELQGVKEEIYYNLLALQDRHLATSDLIRFVDYLWPIQEDTPRTRAKKGALLSAYTPDTALFYPLFNLQNFRIDSAEPWQSSLGYKSAWGVRLTAEEGDAGHPVPTSEDIA